MWQLAMAMLMWFSYCATLAPIPISRTRWVIVADVLTSSCSLHECTGRRYLLILGVLSKSLFRFQRAGTQALTFIHLILWYTITIILIL